MPLVIQENLHKAACWALWHINEDEEELLNQLSLSTNEQTELNKLKHAQRRLEWLASRLLVKQLAGKHYSGRIEVVKDPCGKPLLEGLQAHISLSHAYPYAAAIFNELEAVGIDIEKPRQQLLRVQHKFLSKEEQHCAEENPRKLCIYWAAKEALYKLYGRRALILGEQIKIKPFQLAHRGELQGEIVVESVKKEVSLHYRYREELLICFSL